MGEREAKASKPRRRVTYRIKDESSLWLKRRRQIT